MTHEELADEIELLIDHARAGGMPDQVIIAGLDAAAKALDEEGLPSAR
jgi:hypothetical protein